MEGKDREIYRALNPDEQKDYPCVWYDEVCCPIRTKWKLVPENLTPWCTVCKQIGYLDEERDKVKKKEEVKD